MVVEELVAKLGLRVGGLGEAKKFVKALEDARRAAKGFGKDARFGFSGPSGLGRVTREFERAAAAARRFREEAARAARVRTPSYGAQGGVPGGTGSRGLRAGAASGSRRSLGQGATSFAAGVSGSQLAAASGVYLTGRAMAATTQTAMTFERALIDVGKATDTSGERLIEYGQQIQQVSRDTGKDQVELASLLSAAGFAGRPQNELLRFTEYGAKAAVAWRTSAEETGQALAEIGNIYQANQERIEQIGDAINTAADNSASRETDLLDFMRRAGASGKQAGLSAEQILPFAAAMKEVGVRTDVAATGFEALLNVLKLGDKFSKSAGEGLTALGFKSDTLRKEFVAKPFETILKLLEKINSIKDKMKQAEIMTDLFGKEYQDDIAKLLNGLGQVKKYNDLLNDPKNYRGSVRSQFGEQLNFDVSKIDKASAAIGNLSARLGEYQKIILGFGADKVNKAIDFLEKGLNQKSVDPDTSDAKLREINGMPPLISRDQFSERFGTGTMSVGLERASMQHRTRNGLPSFTRMPGGKYAMDYQKAPEAYYPPTLGATPGSSFGIGGAKSGDWMRQSMQQTVQNITNNTNTGNDQRTQTASVTVNATGLAEVASQVRAQVTSALSSMGPSIAKANTTPTSGASLTGP